jgi:TfdA family taurine catabolism dioxygenase TauD
MMLPPLRLVPQAGPAVWRGADLTPADWMLPIGAEEAGELEAAIAGRSAAAAAGEAPPLPRLAPLLGAVAERLETGRGFVLLRGLPLDRFGEGGTEAALLALAAHLGTALPQDASGRLVRAQAGPGAPPGGPPLRFQADPADAVGLLCLRQAAEGGSVALVSAPALHNALLRADRASLAALHGGLPQRPPPAGAAPASAPVFGVVGGAFAGRCDHAAIALEALDEAQRAALAALEAAAAAPGQALAIPLHPGDLLFRNPHLVWKLATPAEAAAPAGEEVGEGLRQLLRLWLCTPNSRALPEGFRAAFGDIAAGALRGGALRGGVPAEAGGLVGG